MKKSIISSLLIITILISSFSVNATEVPKESAPCYATDEAIAVVENLMGDIFTEVQTGLGYADARAKSNVIIFNDQLNGQTNGYGYGELVDITNAIQIKSLEPQWTHPENWYLYSIQLSSSF